MGIPTFDLNGRWTDIDAGGSPEVTIVHDLKANTVHAQYAEVRRCEDWDGSLLAETTFDFEGTLTGNRIEGKINVCNFGKDFPTKGWVLERLELTVGSDGDTLSGQYFCSVDKNWMPVTFARKIIRDADISSNAPPQGKND
jgi:hypothetical protein